MRGILPSLAAAILLATAAPAFAQADPMEDATGAEAPVGVVAAATGTPARAKKKVDLLVAPVPFSSPASGAGLAGGAVAFYNPNNAPSQWVSGGGIVWTSRGTKGLAGFHSMSFGEDRIRFSAIGSYFDARDSYYGIGAADGDRGEALVLANKRLTIGFKAQARIFEDGYLGVQYRFASTNAHANGEVTTTPLPPADELNSRISMLGPQFSYDTRDNSTQPRQGLNLNASWLFGARAFGDSFQHSKLSLSGSAYFPFGSQTVFATNATVCAAAGDVPFNDMCLFGASNALRGYLTGRYRDRASWAMQGELRHRISNRWGGVAFFGYGGIAPSVGDFISNGNILPAAGAGVRYRPFKGNDVQLRLDVAVGKDTKALYLGIGEAF